MRPVAVLLFFLCFYILNAEVNPDQITNAGFVKSSKKADTTVSLVYKDTLSIPSFTEFSIPVKMKAGNEISAISLGFYFPKEYLEITGMELANGTQGFSYNVTDSLFRMAWSDVNPIIITDDDTIITLSMKSLDLTGLTGTIRLGIYESSEFADKSANVIEGVVLEMLEIKYLVPDTNDLIAGIYPNPFDEYTSINFYLETESKVKISLFNFAGMEIYEAADAIYPKGTHQVRIYAVDLSKGIYLLKFAIINDEQSRTKVIKIMSIR